MTDETDPHLIARASLYERMSNIAREAGGNPSPIEAARAHLGADEPRGSVEDAMIAGADLETGELPPLVASPPPAPETASVPSAVATESAPPPAAPAPPPPQPKQEVIEPERAVPRQEIIPPQRAATMPRRCGKSSRSAKWRRMIGRKPRRCWKPTNPRLASTPHIAGATARIIRRRLWK